MTLKRIRQMVSELQVLLFSTFAFNGMEIEINYISRARHSKRWIVEEHQHPWYEFNFVSQGSVYTTLAGNEFLVKAGESYLIPPGVSHSHRHNQTGDDGICIRFSLKEISEDAREILSVLKPAYSQPLRIDLDPLQSEGGLYHKRAAFTLWLMGIYESLTDSPPVQQEQQGSLAAQVDLYLQEYFRRKIQVTQIATALNTSYRTLARNYKQETGHTIQQQLTAVRLQNAKYLLTNTSLPMYNIAVDSGYENEYYFSKIFKEQESISPSKYREKYAPF